MVLYFFQFKLGLKVIGNVYETATGSSLFRPGSKKGNFLITLSASFLKTSGPKIVKS